jgi:hypothetical protein
MGASWTVLGDQLIKEGLETDQVTFGENGWTDYDLTFETRASAGARAVGAHFRTSNINNDQKCYVLIFGLANKHSLGRWSKSGGGHEIISTPGTIQPHQWYKVRASVRGQSIRIELNDDELFAVDDEFSQSGNIALKCWNSDGRFRNIKVTAPDGTKLWEGPPDLP